jgi:hypothetical protein
MSDDDSELNNLLSQLESEEPISTALTPVEPAPGESAKQETTEPRQELIIAEPERIRSGVAAAEDDPFNIADFIQRFRADYELAHERLAVDRQRQIAANDLVFQRLQGGVATDIETESLFKGLASLTDSNGHLTRLMDSMSKLLSSAKPAFVINQNINNQSDPDELMKILQQDDEENPGGDK